MLKLSYCEICISHYYRDILALIKLSCFSTYPIDMIVFFLAGFDIIVTTLRILVSRLQIIFPLCDFYVNL